MKAYSAIISGSLLLIGAVMICIPLLRSASSYLTLFRTRGIVLEPASINDAFTSSRKELQRWASTMEPIDYAIVVIGSITMILGHAVGLYKDVLI